MSELMAAAGAGLAWAGGSVVVLSDGRRGLGLGLFISAAGLALVMAQLEPLAAAVVAAGGIASAGLRLRDGLPGWGVLPPGSTPRLILCLVAGAAAAYAGVLLGPEGDPWLLIAPLSAAALGVARLLGSRQRQASLASGALFGLALAGIEAASGTASASLGALFAATGASLLSLVPAGGPDAAA